MCFSCNVLQDDVDLLVKPAICSGQHLQDSPMMCNMLNREHLTIWAVCKAT